MIQHNSIACKIRPVTTAVLIISIALVAFLACEESGANIEYVNKTQMAINIYLGDSLKDFDAAVPANSTREVGTVISAWRGVVVGRDDSGKQLFRLEITWQELKKQQYRIEITPEMIAPGGRIIARPVLGAYSTNTKGRLHDQRTPADWFYPPTDIK